MKTIYLLLLASCFFQSSKAQVNLPHTLTFTANDATDWADGIAVDGDGGSSDINGLNIEIYTTDDNFIFFPGSTMRWANNAYYLSNDATYHGITSGPDPDVTMNGVNAMVMRSTNPAVDFSFQSIRLYDWGGYTPLIIAGYNNGTLIGSVEVDFDITNSPPKTISQSDELLPAYFGNIDEVRFFPKAPSTIFNLSFNFIGLALPNTTLPVHFESFTVTRDQNDQSFLLSWVTGSEENNSHFEVEQSTNGSDFHQLGKVMAEGTGGLGSQYSFTAARLSYQEYFFRIRQVDRDGKATYSRIIRIHAGEAVVFTISPNPATSEIRIHATTGMIQQVALYNASGILLFNNRVQSQSYSMNISTLPAGVYMIQLYAGEKVISRKIIKQ